MLRSTLAGLRAHVVRLLATAVAIVLGVGFVAGTLIFGDTAKAALFDQFARAARNVDVSVTPPVPAGPRKEGAPTPVLAAAMLDAVRAVPGVAAADGRMQEYLPLLDRRGRIVSNLDQPGMAISVGNDARLRQFDLVRGRVPARPGEAALDADTAAHTRYTVGDTITVLDAGQHRHPLTLVGVIGFGTSKQYADQSVVAMTPPDMVGLADAGGYRSIVATAAPGVSEQTLRDRVAAAVSPVAPGTSVTTGDRYRIDLADQAIHQVDPFLIALLVFAVVACVVAAFVIYNTFTILIAQRVRELALLRCVGASRSQVFGGVLVESVAVGLVGALAGVGLGLAVAYALFSGATALGAPLPSHPLVLTATPAIVALVVGVVVTVCAALVPALRATRVAPLAALRLPQPGRIGRVRGRLLLVALAVVIGALGTTLTVTGLHQPNPRTATFTVVCGGIVNFLAVLVVSPLFVGPLVAALGWALGLPARRGALAPVGLPVRLGAANARRNPGRTAATTAALMIGVGLMGSASVLVTTVQHTATAQIGAHYPVDYILRAADTGQPGLGVPPEVATRLRAQPQFAGVGELRTDRATLNGQPTVLGTVDPSALGTLAAPDIRAGSLAALHTGTAVLVDGVPETRGKNVGDRVTVTSSDGRTVTLTVAAIATGPSPVGTVLVTWPEFDSLHAAATDDQVLVKAANGVSPTRSRDALDRILADFPAVQIGTVATYRAQITSAVGQLITVVAALLAFAILIALIGIMNTLSLSVFERTRESAISRALGLTRGQLQLTLIAEALLMAVIGALVGVAYGVLYGWATTTVMFAGVHPVLAIPVASLLGYVGLAALAGAAASALPARRAARASIVAAMAET